MRTYRQERYIAPIINVLIDKLCTPGSWIARRGRGAMGLLMAASASISHLFTALVYGFVCLKAYGGAFGIGSVTQYIGAITSLSGGLSALLRALGIARNNAAFLRATFEYLDLPSEMRQGTLTVEKRNDRKYEIELRDVSFRYPGSKVWALRHVNLSFRIGERLAVVGENGSGKTTFIKLLCRLYDPTEGEIRLNGIDIRKYRYDEYLLSVFRGIPGFPAVGLPAGAKRGCQRAFRRRARHGLPGRGRVRRAAARLETGVKYRAAPGLRSRRRGGFRRRGAENRAGPRAL